MVTLSTKPKAPPTLTVGNAVAAAADEQGGGGGAGSQRGLLAAGARGRPLLQPPKGKLPVAKGKGGAAGAAGGGAAEKRRRSGRTLFGGGGGGSGAHEAVEETPMFDRRQPRMLPAATVAGTVRSNPLSFNIPPRCFFPPAESLCTVSLTLANGCFSLPAALGPSHPSDRRQAPGAPR